MKCIIITSLLFVFTPFVKALNVTRNEASDSPHRSLLLFPRSLLKGALLWTNDEEPRARSTGHGLLIELYK